MSQKYSQPDPPRWHMICVLAFALPGGLFAALNAWFLIDWWGVPYAEPIFLVNWVVAGTSLGASLGVWVARCFGATFGRGVSVLIGTALGGLCTLAYDIVNIYGDMIVWPSFVFIICGLAVGFFERAWIDRRRPLAGHCANCGYNLTGLPEPRCPECGTPFAEKGSTS